MRVLLITLAMFLVISAVGCAWLQRIDQRVEGFLQRLLEMVEGWEADGLLPPDLAQRAIDAIEWARENWRDGKAQLLEVMEEVSDWLAGRAVPLDDLDMAVERARADGVLSRAEADALKYR
jgi:hypothetical protein